MVAKLDGTNGLLQQYDYQAPTTGFSYTFAAGVNVLVMNPAGTLATGTITMPASPADGMTISFSSTQTITALTVNANTGQSIVRKPTSFGAGSGMTFVYRLSNTTWYPMTNYATAGTVLQVVSTAKTDTFTTTSTTFTDITGLSVSITPTATSSKIFVIVGLSLGATAGTFSAHPRLMRDSTAIFVSDAAGSRTQAAMMYEVGAAASIPAPIVFLDSPSTTSATTYKIQLRTNNASFAACVNRGVTDTDSSAFARAVSSITVMEIAA